MLDLFVEMKNLQQFFNNMKIVFVRFYKKNVGEILMKIF